MTLQLPTVGPILGAQVQTDETFSQKVFIRGLPSRDPQMGYMRILSEDGGFEQEITFNITKINDYTDVSTILDLPAGTRFTYQIGIAPNMVIDVECQSGGKEGTFKTPNLDTVNTTFSFGSCRYPDYLFDQGKDDRCFKVIVENFIDDDLVIMAGDQIYGDHTAIGGPIGAFSGLLLTYKHYLRLYRKFFARPAFSKVVAAMPTYMIFDDHEIKNGWSKHAFDSRKKKFKRAKVLQAGLKAYDIYQASHAPIKEENKPEYFYEFSHGRCDFFMMDLRYQRDVETNKIILNDQMQQLLSFITNKTDRIKFIVSSVPFCPDAETDSEVYRQANDLGAKLFDAHPDERWEGYPQQRGQILTAIRAEINDGTNKNFIFLSGDIHCSFLHQITHVTDPKFKIHHITSSALNWSFYPGLKDINFRHDTPLKGNENYVPEKLSGDAITTHNFCRVSVKENSIDVAYYKHDGTALKKTTLEIQT